MKIDLIKAGSLILATSDRFYRGLIGAYYGPDEETTHAASGWPAYVALKDFRMSEVNGDPEDLGFIARVQVPVIEWLSDTDETFLMTGEDW